MRSPNRIHAHTTRSPRRVHHTHVSTRTHATCTSNTSATQPASRVTARCGTSKPSTSDPPTHPMHSPSPGIWQSLSDVAHLIPPGFRCATSGSDCQVPGGRECMGWVGGSDGWLAGGWGLAEWLRCITLHIQPSPWLECDPSQQHSTRHALAHQHCIDPYLKVFPYTHHPHIQWFPIDRPSPSACYSCVWLGHCMTAPAPPLSPQDVPVVSKLGVVCC